MYGMVLPGVVGAVRVVEVVSVLRLFGLLERVMKIPHLRNDLVAAQVLAARLIKHHIHLMVVKEVRVLCVEELLEWRVEGRVCA